MAENFRNSIQNIALPNQEAQPTPSRINGKGSCGSSYGEVKILKDKEKTLKEGRGKQIVTYNRTTVRLKTLSETLEARRQWDDIFKVQEESTFNEKFLI